MPGAVPALHHGLVPNTKYRFTYQLPGQRKRRTGVAIYLMQTSVPGLGEADLLFSGRPEFGTMTIRSEWLESIEITPPETPNHINRMVK